MIASKFISKFGLIFSVLLLSLLVVYVAPSKASALSGSEFEAGRIIDDAVFFNGNNLGAQDIQSFLNAKVPVCDTNGTQPYAGTTRAAYGASKGYPAPYICLKDFRQDTPTRSAESGLCNQFFGGNKSAAQIIHEVGQACGVSQRVLLILLEKEQSLVTDDWPWSIQYRSATGYGCPDTAPCDAEYYGFFNQVYNAARQFKRYAKFPDSYNYVAQRNNYIQYNPNASCGGSTVFIQNQATAGLYNYTPYQPNQSALNNLYGSGDSCGAYGNRNFWRLYNDYFGSTTRFNGSILLSQNLTLSKQDDLHTGDTITASYQIQNTASFDIDAGGFGVCARMNGQNYDFGFIHRQVIPANGSVSISFARQVLSTGSLSIFICSYNEALGFASNYYPYNSGNASIRSIDLQIRENPLITTGITLTPANPAKGQLVTGTITVRNYSNSPFNIGSLILSARDPNGANVDFAEEANIVVPANGTYTYSKTRPFNSSGAHQFSIVNWRGGSYDRTYPKSVDGTIVRQSTVQILDNPVISSGLSLSPTSPAIGQPTTATMTFRNSGSTPINIGSMVVGARDPSGNNVDFTVVNDVIIPANGTYTYTQTKTFTTAGDHSLFVANWNGSWNTSLPKSADTSIVRQLKIKVLDNPLVISGITLSPSNPTAGQPVTAIVSIRNYSPNPVNIGLFLVAGRTSSGANIDFSADNEVVIPGNSTYTYSKTQSFNSGDYSLFMASLQNSTWSRTYPASASDSSIARQTILSVN